MPSIDKKGLGFIKNFENFNFSLEDWWDDRPKRFILLGVCLAIFLIALEIISASSSAPLTRKSANVAKEPVNSGKISDGVSEAEKKRFEDIKSKKNEEIKEEIRPAYEEKIEAGKSTLVSSLLESAKNHGLFNPVAKQFSPLGEIEEKYEKLGSPESLAERIRQEIVSNSNGDELSHSELIEKIALRMRSEDEKSAIEAALALQVLVDTDDAKQLVTLLEQASYNDSAREILIKTIGELSDNRAFRALKLQLEMGKRVHRYATIEALGAIKDDRSIPVLMEVINDETGLYRISTRQHAVTALKILGTPKALYALKTGILVTSPQIVEAAKWAIAHLTSVVKTEVIDNSMPEGLTRYLLNYRGTQYYYYHPPKRVGRLYPPRLLVCIHDTDLGVDSLFNRCMNLVRGKPIAVLSPVFDNVLFPQYGSFSVKNQQIRADKRLLNILKTINEHSNVDVREIYLLGIGEGARFSQNFILAYPFRVARSVLVDPPLITVPSDKMFFPYGLRPSPLAPDLEFNQMSFTKSDTFIALGSSIKGNKALAKGIKQWNAEHLVNGITPRWWVGQIAGFVGNNGDAGANKIRGFLWPQTKPRKN